MALAFLLMAVLPVMALEPATLALVQSGQEKNADYLLAIHLKLAPGWMTYWRQPGEAGIAPQFRTEGSENLKSIEVLFPAPKLFHEGGYTTLGYEKEVLLPLRVTPQDATEPVLLRLTVNYGVCEKICLPGEHKFEVLLARKINPAERLSLLQAMEKVPQRNNAALSEIQQGKNNEVRFVLKSAESYDFAILEPTVGQGAYVASMRREKDTSFFTFILPELQAETLPVRVTVVGAKSVFAEKILSFRSRTKNENKKQEK